MPEPCHARRRMPCHAVSRPAHAAPIIIPLWAKGDNLIAPYPILSLSYQYTEYIQYIHTYYMYILYECL